MAGVLLVQRLVLLVQRLVCCSSSGWCVTRPSVDHEEHPVNIYHFASSQTFFFPASSATSVATSATLVHMSSLFTLMRLVRLVSNEALSDLLCSGVSEEKISLKTRGGCAKRLSAADEFGSQTLACSFGLFI